LWDKTAAQVLDDIHKTFATIREQVMRLIYARYPEKAERSALCKALKTLAYQENNVLHRWVRDASGRGHTQVDNHIVPIEEFVSHLPFIVTHLEQDIS
jgi:N-acetylglucosamine kinase-like BadF-type ATPase